MASQEVGEGGLQPLVTVIGQSPHLPQGREHQGGDELLGAFEVLGAHEGEGQGLGHVLQGLALLGALDGPGPPGLGLVRPGSGQEGAQVRLQLLPGGALDELLVDPLQLVHIEAGGALLAVVQVEELDHLGVREQFFLGALHGLAIDLGGPGEPGQGQAHGGGQQAHGLILRDAGGAVALAQLGAVRPQDHGHMGEGRQVVAEGLEERDLLGGVVQVVVAPDHVGHFHLGVIHHHAEVVGGHADLAGAVAGAGDDPVVQAVGREAGVALDEVADHDVPTHGHAEADGGGLAGIMAGLGAAFPGVQAPVVLEDLARLLYSRTAESQSFPVTAAAVGQALVQQVLDAGPIAVHALHLAVGAVGSGPGAGIPHHRALIPVQAAPGHAFLDDADVVVGAAGEVRVLDAQDEAAAVSPGEEPAEEGSTDPPDVEHAGGRWGKAGDDRAGHGGLSLQPPSVPQPAGWRDGPIPRRR